VTSQSPTEHDADLIDVKTLWQLGAKFVDVVDVDIKYFTGRSIECVMMVIDVRIESHCATVAMHELNLAHGCQLIERLVHRAQRNTRHALARHLVQTLGRRVRFVAVHQGEQQLTLRGQATALVAVGISDDFG